MCHASTDRLRVNIAYVPVSSLRSLCLFYVKEELFDIKTVTFNNDHYDYFTGGFGHGHGVKVAVAHGGFGGYGGGHGMNLI